MLGPQCIPDFAGNQSVIGHIKYYIKKLIKIVINIKIIYFFNPVLPVLVLVQMYSLNFRSFASGSIPTLASITSQIFNYLHFI